MANMATAEAPRDTMRKSPWRDHAEPAAITATMTGQTQDVGRAGASDSAPASVSDTLDHPPKRCTTPYRLPWMTTAMRVADVAGS